MHGDTGVAPDALDTRPCLSFVPGDPGLREGLAARQLRLRAFGAAGVLKDGGRDGELHGEWVGDRGGEDHRCVCHCT